LTAAALHAILSEPAVALPASHPIDTTGAGDKEQLKELLEGGADRDEKDEEGRTALCLRLRRARMRRGDSLLQTRAAGWNKHAGLHCPQGVHAMAAAKHFSSVLCCHM
jgi:hypothetical protein